MIYGQTGLVIVISSVHQYGEENFKLIHKIMMQGFEPMTLERPLSHFWGTIPRITENKNFLKIITKLLIIK
jgi:hypothetical protein